MDEKRALYERVGRPAQYPPAARSSSRSVRRVRYLVALLLVAFCVYHYTAAPAVFGVLPIVVSNLDLRPAANQRPMAGASDSKPLVPLEAHIMSKCPDARDCLRMLVLPAMQRVINKVNFTLSYIGTPTENDGVDCMHGPEECLGNIMLLCAADLYPDPKTYLGFSMCMIKDYQDIPQRSLIEDCALEHAIDFGKLSECASRDDGAFGVDMLRSSVRRSSEAHVTKSCTVRLNEEIYCIRDGGEWKDCPKGPGVNDLVVAVEKLYRSFA